VVPQSELSIVSVGGAPLVGHRAAESAIDSRGETLCGTNMGARGFVHPHELVVALGEELMEHPEVSGMAPSAAFSRRPS
jgi:hypothetical protein